MELPELAEALAEQDRFGFTMSLNNSENHLKYVAILKNNYVINTIFVAEQHLQDLDSMLYSLGGDKWMIYTEDSPAYIGGDLYNNKFRPPHPGNEDAFWSEEVEMWLLPEDDIEAALWGKNNPFDPSRLNLKMA
jgi:hypothetical protein